MCVALLCTSISYHLGGSEKKNQVFNEATCLIRKYTQGGNPGGRLMAGAPQERVYIHRMPIYG